MKKIAVVPVITLALSVMLVQIGICQNPPGIKWKKIETPHFEVIFPEEITHEGQRVANTMEYLYSPLCRTMGVDMKRISILLTNQGVISNGYVALAPRMSEWLSSPPQDSLAGPGEWYNLLAAHEGRHITQFDKMNQGIIQAAWVLFGETGQLLLSVISAPPWFWEKEML